MKMATSGKKTMQTGVLTVLNDDPSPKTERTALDASLPDDAFALSAYDEKAEIRRGQDTVLLDTILAGKRVTRGFLKCVLNVPLTASSELGQTYGVFVELNREDYMRLQEAHRAKTEARAWGTLANKLPLLEAAYETKVEILEAGGQMRPRIIAADSVLLREGPEIGPITATEDS